ncbi:MAG: preprotein translocase subunit SecG [Hyphomonadaceae bacterium]|nr:preprotein translocase subunit SecG [Hyphomonadaceae bacterium]
MLAVLLTIHMIACVALVVAVMLQRSEGGALGMGGGGTGGVISGRGAAGVLVNVTMILAGVFFFTSVAMTRLNNEANAAPSTLEQQQQQLPVDPFNPLTGAPATTTAPVTTAPATTAPATPAPAPAVDPLAPRSNTPAPATNTAPAPTAPAPATTTPTVPAPAPENGGSNN